MLQRERVTEETKVCQFCVNSCSVLSAKPNWTPCKIVWCFCRNSEMVTRATERGMMPTSPRRRLRSAETSTEKDTLTPKQFSAFAAAIFRVDQRPRRLRDRGRPTLHRTKPPEKTHKYESVAATARRNLGLNRVNHYAYPRRRRNRVRTSVKRWSLVVAQTWLSPRPRRRPFDTDSFTTGCAAGSAPPLEKRARGPRTCLNVEHARALASSSA